MGICVTSLPLSTSTTRSTSSQPATKVLPLAMAGVVTALLDAVPDGARGLAVGHTPLIERAVFGISAREIAPLGECEGVLLSREDDEHPVRVEELRLL